MSLGHRHLRHEKLDRLKIHIQGDILSMSEREIECKSVKLDNKTLIKR